MKDIYRKLGPFDHFEHYDKDENIETDRVLEMQFDTRKSGAMYRGQISADTARPDGMGIKIFPNNSVFEGHFDDGKINGWGRGITSRGEIYQGPFENDVMQGEGLFQWPDGRLYYGKFDGGKKHGPGIYMWANGQTYVGDFKYDECQGAGKLYYPDGKVFEGQWVGGKKNGPCIYSWPNGAKYFVTYKHGVAEKDGRLQGAVDLDAVKSQYASLAKKANKSINLLKEATFKVEDEQLNLKRQNSMNKALKQAIRQRFQ